MDSRIPQLARQLVNHSTRLSKGDKVLIECFDCPSEVPVAIVDAAREVSALPFVNIQDSMVTRALISAAEPERLELLKKHALQQMKSMDAYIAIRGSYNINELSDAPADSRQAYISAMWSVTNWRVKNTRWVVLRWPNAAMAQQAGMSTRRFQDFYFDVCLLDYGKFVPGMEALVSLMNDTDQVHITGEGTDLRFSIKDIPAIACGGEHNIPDGEVFTAPVRDSVEGVISYNAPTIYQGMGFNDVRLEFSKGQIIKAEANNSAKLNEILDSDEGARYIGEFAIGFNPQIREPMRDILFDEKIAGSFHFTPGQAYDEADNGNRSKVHWDLVSIQRPEYGGGEIRFDDKLIRKNGIFVIEELDSLNG